MTARLLVVGAGPAATTLLYQLTRALCDAGMEQTLEILLVGRDDHGPGLAFSTTNPYHLLNVEASMMSVDPANPKHFLQWCHENADTWRGRYPCLNLDVESHPPRYLFGMYLMEELRSIREFASSCGIRMEQRRDEVIAVQPEDSRFIATFSSGAEEVFNYIVLATGHQPPDTFQDLDGSPGYSTSPTRVSVFPLGLEPISIIGSRLSAIDAVFELVSLGYAGRIHMVSRSGWLPKVACPSGTYALRYLTTDFIAAAGVGTVDLDTFMDLLKREVEHSESRPLDWDLVLSTGLSSAEAFRREVEVARTRTPRPWEAVLLSLYDGAPWLWHTFTGDAKLEFHRRYYSIWMTYLATVPLLTAERILPLLESGQLTVHGGLRSISYDSSSSTYALQLDRKPDCIFSKALINATGPGYEVTRSRSALLMDLLTSAMVTPHPCGGVRVDIGDFRVKAPGGHPARRGLFALGDLTHGDWLATADLGHVASQASILIKALLSEC
jgi:uncharacterized NAD(P)/FAD-binding protein YdhS